MPINTQCPGCQGQFQLPDQLAGQQVQCQSCQTVFAAPSPNTPVAASSAPSPPTKPTPPPASQQGFTSVFDSVSAPPTSAPSGGLNPPAPPTGTYAGGYGSHTKSSGGGKGLVVGGILGCAVIFIGLIGFSGWYIYSSFASAVDEKWPDVESINEAAKESIGNIEEKYGKNSIVRIRVDLEGSTSYGPQASQYLSRMATETIRKTGTKGGYQAVVRGIGDNRFEVVAGPVDDVQNCADSISWGDVKKVDVSGRIIRVAAVLPDADKLAATTSIANRSTSKKTFEQIAAEQRANEIKRAAEAKIREAERAARAHQADLNAKAAAKLAEQKRLQREEERIIRDADRKHIPRPGESTMEWVNREFDTDSSMGRFFESLGKMDVEKENRDAISQLLIEYLRDNGTSNFAELLDAMLKWRTPAVESEILSLVGDPQYRLQGKPLMRALEKLGTPEAAEKLAVAIPDFFSGDGSVNHLIRMGAAAEEAVLNYRKHDEAKVRSRVYRILAEIGTEKSLEPLEQNRRLEKNADMKAQAKQTIEKIRERHPETETDDN